MEVALPVRKPTCVDFGSNGFLYVGCAASSGFAVQMYGVTLDSVTLLSR